MALAASLAGCEPGTGGRPITFELTLGGPSILAEAARDPRRFTTTTGWQVTLEEACLAIGPMYLFAGPSHLQESARLAPSRWLPRLVRQAHAHPGHEHFAGGEVRGEWLGQIALDVLDPGPRPLGMHNGLHGAVRAYSLRLDPPRGPLAEDPCLRGHHAWVRGTATRDGDTVDFEGGLIIPNIGTNRRVDGLPLRAAIDQGSRVVLAVDPAAWLDLAEFETLLERAPGGRLRITPDSQVHRAWFIGARSASAFMARVTSE